MIKGLTHDENGVLEMVTKYKGKIGAGYAPGEGPNKGNYPQAAGFFRILKEVTATTRIGASQKEAVIKSWVLNEQVQKAAEEACKSSQPRVIEFVCLHKTIDEMWESSLGMFTSDGLSCRSFGKGTNARHLTFNREGERLWVDRLFNGVGGCPMHDCPDYKEGKCTPHGLLKCFPVVDMSPNPYKFESKSYSTIRGIESQLNSFWSLLNAAHAVKVAENNGKPLQFDGFFGCKFFLVHKKAKSGGRDIFITDIVPTPSFTKMVMEPIKRGLIMNQKAVLNSAGAGVVNLLSSSAEILINNPPSESSNISDQQNQVSTSVDLLDSEGESALTDNVSDKVQSVIDDLIDKK